jgi:lipid-binding SYLF domain-containing protein
MITKKYKLSGLTIACLLAASSMSGLVAAQSASPAEDTAKKEAPASTSVKKHETTAMKHVSNSVSVVRKMESEAGMSDLLQKAKGVFIMPAYGRVAVGVGGSGGSGVLLVKREDSSWSDPIFYHVGGISFGAQVGAEGGPIAMVLNNDKAVESFMQKNDFSLSADAGLTVINWNATAQGSVGIGDVVAWSGTKGLFGNVASIGLNSIRFSKNETEAYYHQSVLARDVVNGIVSNPQSNVLKERLEATTNIKMNGGSGKTGKSK